MTTIRAAFYARVSSEQQATAHTIESQTAALSERAQNDGTPVPPDRQFVDDGYSGATLIRPELSVRGVVVCDRLQVARDRTGQRVQFFKVVLVIADRLQVPDDRAGLRVDHLQIVVVIVDDLQSRDDGVSQGFTFPQFFGAVIHGFLL